MTVAATLPLAFVMIAGPQIISAFFFATSEKWKSDSAYFVLGGAVGLLLIVTAAYLLASGTSGRARNPARSRSRSSPCLCSRWSTCS